MCYLSFVALKVGRIIYMLCVNRKPSTSLKGVFMTESQEGQQQILSKFYENLMTFYDMAKF